MLEWKRDFIYVQEYVEELMRLEGLTARKWDRQACFRCSRQFPPHDPQNRQSRILRCMDCFGYPLECVDCCLARHQHIPLHLCQVRTVSNYHVPIS